MKKNALNWDADIKLLLPKKEGYNNLETGIYKKRIHIARYMPELMDGTERTIADVGAGCGFFCRACMDLRHTATAVLHPGHGEWAEGFKKACEFLDVEFKLYDWGSGDPPFKEEECDIVNSEGMLGMNDADTWEKILDEMLHITKKGGVIVLLVNATRCDRNRHVIDKWVKNRPIEMANKWEHGWKWRKK